MMDVLDRARPLQTRDGQCRTSDGTLVIWTWEGKAPEGIMQAPIRGEYLDEHFGWTASSWSANGHWCGDEETPYDLINEPEGAADAG